MDAAAAAGYAGTVDAIVATLTPGGDTAADAVALPDLTPPSLPGKHAPVDQRQAYNHRLGQQAASLVEWWVERMIVAQQPAAEKLAWFWHGHFATSIDKVKIAALMYRQNQIFRHQGAGDFTDLTGVVAQDPAMLRWLDADTNVAAHPNENFARELMELFTLGIGNYGETDVKEAARTFTGWSFDQSTLAFVERARLHDSGIKTILGQIGSVRRPRHDPAHHPHRRRRPFRGRAAVVSLRPPGRQRPTPSSRIWRRHGTPVAAPTSCCAPCSRTRSSSPTPPDGDS